METPRDELHLLVRSLNASEKRLFKMFMQQSAGRTSEKTLALFDALVRMETYSAEALRHALKGKLPLAHLSSTKSRLFQLLLKSLRQQQEGQDLGSELALQSQEIALLLHRGLFKSARKRLHQAQEKARRHEYFRELLGFQELQMEFHLQLMPKGGQEHLAQLASEMEDCLSMLQKVNLLRNLHEQFRNLSQQKSQRNPDGDAVTATGASFMAHPLLQAPPPDQSLLARSYHQNLWGIHFIRRGQFDQAHPYYAPLVQAWQALPHMIATYPQLYLGIVNNYLTVVLFTSQLTDQFPQLIRPIKALDALTGAHAIKLQRIAHYHELNYHLNYGTYQSGMVFIGKLNRWLEKFQDHLEPQRRLVFEFSIASFFFVYGEFSRANRHLLHIINFPSGKERQDIRDFARLMQLMVQHELGNQELNDYLVRSTYRYFQRGQRLYAYERALIRYFNQVEKREAGDLTKAAEEVLQQKLTEIRAREGAFPIGLSLISIWLESKLQGTSIRQHFETVIGQQRSSG